MPSARSHVAGLDVLRGVAITLVMLRHAAPDIFDGAGIVGVVMFFALSGYLITGTLMGNIERRGRVDYKRFYTNRALRLLPAMLTMLVIFVVVELIAGPENGPGQLVVAAVVAGFYLQDLYLADVMPTLTYRGLNGLWTLAIEEQFYLVWPALLTVFVRRRMLEVGVWATVIVCVVTCAFTLVAALAFSTPSALYSLPTTWAVALVLGGAAYIHRDRLERTESASPWQSPRPSSSPGSASSPTPRISP